MLTRNVQSIAKYNLKSLNNINYFDIVVSIPIVIFLIYYVSTKGIRLSGEFVDLKKERSIWVDYMYVYAIISLVVLRGSSVITVLIMLLSVAHLLAAERMRAFVYILSCLIIFYQIDKKKHQSTIILLAGFFIATALGILRIGDIQISDSYNVTHFGSVSISSLYLLDESLSFTLIEEIKFFFGILTANLIPSSLLIEEYNIRLFLINAQDIPGGGWFPVWIYAVSGYSGLIFATILLAYYYKWLLCSKSEFVISKHEIAKYVMLVIFISTIPRWFMYTPYQVLKMPLYGYIGSLLLLNFIKLFSKERNDGQFKKRI
ncbi:MAG: hypothetical protein GY828_05380 [Candidatus Gracilibacteria bacterium]|nr:hypothetical protein [Candidatus Gracilibacteria bacterium]